MDDEPTESIGLTDINFIVTSHGSTIYDLATGTQYVYKLDRQHNPIVFIWRVDSPKEGTGEPAYTGAEAMEFWKALHQRISMNY